MATPYDFGDVCQGLARGAALARTVLPPEALGAGPPTLSTGQSSIYEPRSSECRPAQSLTPIWRVSRTLLLRLR